MDCPHCGYRLDGFGQECPRCHGDITRPKQANNPPAVHVDASQAIAPMPAASLAVEPPSEPIPVGPVPVHPAPRRLTLVCPVCDSETVQKVSVIYDAGTQYSSSSGTTRGTSVAVGYVWGSGPMPIVGANSSKTSTDHSSQTRLAATLSPPHRPSNPSAPSQPQPPVLQWERTDSKGEVILFYLLLGWGIPGICAYWAGGYRPSWDSWGLLFAISVGPVLLCFAFSTCKFVFGTVQYITAHLRLRAERAIWREQSSQLMAGWKQNMAAWRKECAAIEARWRQQTANWDSLFYCHRCDHVFHVETKAAAPASQMNSIL